ncbi:MAG: omptin family outer membrane protease [Treponemataceae bacterium]|nr:omptin family outer membrane protease [Treponemataceae bacterium]
MQRISIGIAIYLLCIAGSLPVAFPQEQRVLPITLVTETTLLWGSVEELVYQDGRQVSRLVWDTQWVPRLGVKGVFTYQWLIGTLEASTAFPVRSGRLEDFDYLLEDTTKPSKYSWHEAYLDKDMSLGASIGIRLPFGSRGIIKPQVEITYQNRKWSGYNGYLQYPLSGYWTGNENKQSVAGTVISYEQVLWYPSIALIVEGLISEVLELSCLAAWIPYLEIHALDSHYIRNPPVEFYDKLSHGMGWRGEIKLGFLGKTHYPSTTSWYLKLGFRSFSITGPTASRQIGLGDGIFRLDPAYSAGSREFTWQCTVGLIP